MGILLEEQGLRWQLFFYFANGQVSTLSDGIIPERINALFC